MEVVLSGSVDEVILADLQFVIEITTTIVTNPRSVGKILFFMIIAIKYFKKLNNVIKEDLFQATLQTVTNKPTAFIAVGFC